MDLPKQTRVRLADGMYSTSVNAKKLPVDFERNVKVPYSSARLPPLGKQDKCVLDRQEMH
jgi:hypothetical protein